ncbi:MAG TPA: glycosyltransferase [Fibrobacteria bacterium]|nr:glycosyltransferase [Fibrobacteria bacterium]
MSSTGDGTTPTRLPLSILIPSYMRDAVLWRTVKSLGAQLEEGDEVIVVDQNDPPLAPPVDLAPLPLRLVRLDRPSLTRARNVGIAAARNGHLVFLDDDIVPDPALLAAFRRAARANPGCILAGAVDQDDIPADVESPGRVDFRTGEIRTNFSRPPAGEVPFFPGGLNLIPRSALGPRPWFDPRFRGSAHGEEIDFSLRARARGVHIVADPSIRVFHLKVVEGGCRAPEFRRRFVLDHAYNMGLFQGKHGRLGSIAGFLRRVKGFVEFHTRSVGGGHDAGLVAWAFALTGRGFFTGLGLRLGRGG